MMSSPALPQRGRNLRQIQLGSGRVLVWVLAWLNPVESGRVSPWLSPAVLVWVLPWLSPAESGWVRVLPLLPCLSG